jgi:hypothetical protein
MQSATPPPEEGIDARAAEVFKALSVFSLERRTFAGLDVLDHWHWADVARMIRTARDLAESDADAQGRALTLEAVEAHGVSPAKLATSVAKVGGAIADGSELSIGGMTLQVLREMASRRRPGPGRRWIKRKPRT